VSVDAGSQAVYEQMHGSGPSIDFEKTVEGVRRLAAEKQTRGSRMTLGVSFLLTPENFLDLTTAARVFGAIPGVDYFQVKPLEVSPVERARHPSAIYWNRRVFDTLMALRAHETETFRVHALGFKFTNMMSNEARGLPFSRCWGHPFYPTICADGTVVVCCLMVNSVFEHRDVGVYGKVDAERGFRRVWEDARRFAVGSGISTRLCPSNCKLAETNRTLEEMFGAPPMHENFIG
jgi:hypothetical protein